MGKYSHVIDTLPRFQNQDQTYLDKINVRKTEIVNSVRDNAEYLAQVEADDERLAEIERLTRQGLAQLKKAQELLIKVSAGRRQGAVFARAYRECRAVKDGMYEVESDLNLTIAAYEALIVDQYEVEGTSGLKLDDGASVSVQYEPYAQVLDKDKHREWAIKQGLERSLALPWQTTNAITKERLLQGLDAPDGVTAQAKPKIVLRKG